MIPTPGQHVKLFYRNNAVVEGIVHTWGDPVVLISLSDNAFIIIPDVKVDICLIKVMRSAPEAYEPHHKPQETTSQQQISAKLQETLIEPDPDLQKLSIAELKQLANQQERQILAGKIRQHFSGNPSKSPYDPQVSLFIKGSNK